MLAFWLQLRRRRCRSISPRRPARFEQPPLRCVLPRGHELTGRTAFERQHRHPVGSDVRFWP